jgi:hypothetical protein
MGRGYPRGVSFSSNFVKEEFKVEKQIRRGKPPPPPKKRKERRVHSRGKDINLWGY